MWTCLFVLQNINATRQRRKEVFIPLSHRFIVTAAHLHSPFTSLKPTLVSSQGQDANSNQIPRVQRSIFPHSCSYPLQNNGCFVDRCSTHPPSSVTNSASLGFLYQLGCCYDKVLFLSKTRACVIEQIITIQQGRKMPSSQKDPFTLHLPRRAYLIFFPLHKSTRDIACVLWVVDGL